MEAKKEIRMKKRLQKEILKSCFHLKKMPVAFSSIFFYARMETASAIGNQPFFLSPE